MPLKTLGDFVELLRQSQNLFVESWLSRLQYEVGEKEWQESMAFDLNASTIIALADAVATLLFNRLAGICTEELYERTLREGHDLLKEIHQRATEQGIDVSLQQIDRPLTYTEMAEAAGIIKVENGMVSLTKQGERTAKTFWGNRLDDPGGQEQGVQHDCPACGVPIDSLVTGDDGISRCPNCGCQAREGLVIRITEIPKGTAPREVRKSWVGMELLAEVYQGPEFDLITRQEIPHRGNLYAVPKDFALEALESKDPEAAEWFHQNMPSKLGCFTFGMDEAELVGKITVFDIEL
ncbi:MAG: hypothetical protein Q8K92_12095 [Leadbetterella sp.]|nr:hypothetical protein [Leadbetterella sp.]